MWTNHILCDIFIMKRAFIETRVFEKNGKMLATMTKT